MRVLRLKFGAVSGSGPVSHFLTNGFPQGKKQRHLQTEKAYL